MPAGGDELSALGQYLDLVGYPVGCLEDDVAAFRRRRIAEDDIDDADGHQDLDVAFAADAADRRPAAKVIDDQVDDPVENGGVGDVEIETDDEIAAAQAGIGTRLVLEPRLRGGRRRDVDPVGYAAPEAVAEEAGHLAARIAAGCSARESGGQWAG